MTLDLLPGVLAVCRLDPDAALEAWMGQGSVSSITRTPVELSVVCQRDGVPEGVVLEDGWRALALRGPIPFELTGVLTRLLDPLAAAEVSIFAISTYDTDVVMVKALALEDAVTALRAEGHTVEGA
ncbi:ACT domain-containing protein [Rubrivirga sp.]|uniref:ACT domain-containing protein n=1 Tax=Rubrivirga sp. TaxID=1885344 RepID=UPI003C769389